MLVEGRAGPLRQFVEAVHSFGITYEVEGKFPADQQFLKKFVGHEIGPIARPDVIQFAPGLPKTRSGKIMRRILRKIAEDDVGNLGRPGANWITSGAANGPISWRTQPRRSACSASEGVVSVFSVTKQ